MIPRGTNLAREKIVALTSTVFLGAFLLFGMEPLVGRFLTPLLGGTAHVWLICLMFFQAMLLVGYLYSHLFARKTGVWHLALLLLPFAALPFDIRHLPGTGYPVGDLLFVLLVHVALPFVVLSTTAVVVQVWLSESISGKGYDPYPLYAASNAGSFVALFGYCFVIEPFVGLRMQSILWTAVYIVYVALAGISWYSLFGDRRAVNRQSETGSKTALVPLSRVLYLKWILLSGLPSAFLLAVTNVIILEIGSFPLTWTIPLGLYLVSFIVTFRTGGGTPGWLRRLWPEILMVAMLFYLVGPANLLSAFITLILFFLICLVSHGSLYEFRPPPQYLTGFYLAVAFGGWLGGAAVSLLAPMAFSGLYEYPLLLILFTAVLFWCRHRSVRELLPDFTLFGFLRASLILLVVVQAGRMITISQEVRFQHRNFYGSYRVVDTPSTDDKQRGIRTLVHGSTLHGAQWLDGDEQKEPIYYYYRGGAISQAISAIPSPKSIAVVGLGAGAAAAFVGERDRVTFYEIDPDIEPMARRWFTYLDDSKAEQRVVVGDGRVSMQRDCSKNIRYDLIFVDAFSGDGIPVHLLTLEAADTYRGCLADDNGLLVFHVSNRFYELRPLIKAIARERNLHGALNVPLIEGQLRPEQFNTWCVALTSNRRSLQPLLDAGWIRLGEDELNPMHHWSDDFSNPLEPLWEGVKLRYRGWKIVPPWSSE